MTSAALGLHGDKMSFSRLTGLRPFVLGSMPMVLGACTLVGEAPPAPAPPRVEPDPVPAVESDRSGEVAPAVGAAAQPVTARVVEIALESIGTPYEWGGTDANGFDCSGLIQFAYAKLGIRIPRRSTAQMRAGSPVAPDPTQLRPGDVLGFSYDSSRSTGHVGLYIGADEFIHSSSSGVRISTLDNPYWRQKLVAARRMVE